MGKLKAVYSLSTRACSVSSKSLLTYNSRRLVNLEKTSLGRNLIAFDDKILRKNDIYYDNQSFENYRKHLLL